MTAIVVPINQCSIFRVKDLLDIVLMEALSIMGLLSIEEIRSAMRNFLRLMLFHNESTGCPPSALL